METVELVKKHHGKLLSKEGFFDVFYDTFLDSHPSVRGYFKGVDFAEQKRLLRHGLNLIIMHADDNIAGTSGLTRIRETHSPKKLNIPRALYTHWKESFLKSIKKVDPEVSPEQLRAWEQVLDQAITQIATT